MANNNRWGDFKGWVANQLASGNVYDTNTNSYAPQNVMNLRLASGVASHVGGPAGALLGLGGKLASNRMDGAQRFDRRMEMPIARESFDPGSPGMNVSNIGQPAIGGIGALQGGQMGGGFGPSPFTPAGYNFANPGPSSQSPGGFSNGIFNGGSGNFGPSPSFGGPVTGGGGNRGALNFGGYDSQAHMDASINATQEGMQAARSASPNNRQAGGDIRGNRYQF